MHLNPQFKPNIISTSISPLNLSSNVQNTSKIFFLIFLYFYWLLFMCHFDFLFTIYYMKVHFLLLPQHLILSQGGAYQHIGSTWRFGHLMLTGAKRPGKQVYASETYSRMASLLSVYTHWGGEPPCLCTLYLLISFIIH